jgi:hypothetical protein
MLPAYCGDGVGKVDAPGGAVCIGDGLSREADESTIPRYQLEAHATNNKLTIETIVLVTTTAPRWPVTFRT